MWSSPYLRACLAGVERTLMMPIGDELAKCAAAAGLRATTHAGGPFPALEELVMPLSSTAIDTLRAVDGGREIERRCDNGTTVHFADGPLRIDVRAVTGCAVGTQATSPQPPPR